MHPVISINVDRLAIVIAPFLGLVVSLNDVHKCFLKPVTSELPLPPENILLYMNFSVTSVYVPVQNSAIGKQL
jgi:hypothetical protein